MRGARGLVAGAAVVGLALTGAGCGSSSSGLSAGASSELQASVQGVQNAAVAGNRTLAAQRLVALQGEVAALQKQGQISASRAHDILAAVSSVQAQLVDLPAPTTTTTTTTTTIRAPAATTPATAPAHPAPHHSPPPKHGDGGGGGGDHHD